MLTNARLIDEIVDRAIIPAVFRRYWILQVIAADVKAGTCTWLCLGLSKVITSSSYRAAASISRVVNKLASVQTAFNVQALCSWERLGKAGKFVLRNLEIARFCVT